MAENNLAENGRLVYAKGFTYASIDLTLTAIAAAGNVWAWRNIGPEEFAIDSLAMKVNTQTVFGAAQSLAFAAYKVSGFTALPTGGLAIDPSRKRVADHELPPTTESVASRSNGVALGAGTFTVVTDEPIDVLLTDFSVSPKGESLWSAHSRIPHTIGPNEGIIIRSLSLMGASGVCAFFAGLDVRKA
jgi:hypothetical protein